MYNRNYDGFDYVRIRQKLLYSLLNRKVCVNSYILTVIRDRCMTLNQSKPLNEKH